MPKNKTEAGWPKRRWDPKSRCFSEPPSIFPFSVELDEVEIEHLKNRFAVFELTYVATREKMKPIPNCAPCCARRLLRGREWNVSSMAQIPMSPAPSDPVSCPLEKAVEKFAAEAKIAHRGVEILNWCQFMGAVDLAELGGCVDQFSSDLNLKPFEIARARKYLEGLGQ